MGLAFGAPLGLWLVSSSGFYDTELEIELVVLIKLIFKSLLAIAYLPTLITCLNLANKLAQSASTLPIAKLTE